MKSINKLFTNLFGPACKKLRIVAGEVICIEKIGTYGSAVPFAAIICSLILVFYLLSLIMGISDDYNIVLPIQFLLAAMTLYHCIKYPKTRTIILLTMSILCIGIYTQTMLSEDVPGYESGGRTFLIHVICGVIAFAGIQILQNSECKPMKFLTTINGCYVLTGIAVAFYIACCASGEVFGAANWISIAGFSFHGTEFCKLIYLWTLGVISSDVEQFDRNGAVLMTIFLINAGFLVICSELGYLIIITLVTVTMVFICTRDIKAFLHSAKPVLIIVAILMLLCILTFVAFSSLAPEESAALMTEKIKGRILGFLYPNLYANSYGYQAEKAQQAIFSGGLIGGDEETKLPIAQSDMVFAYLIARMGVLFGLITLMLYSILFICACRAADSKCDGMCMTLCAGLYVQAIYNVAMVIGCVPIAGIPLYFISEGGTAIICAAVMISVIISRINEKEG